MTGYIDGKCDTIYTIHTWIRHGITFSLIPYRKLQQVTALVASVDSWIPCRSSRFITAWWELVAMNFYTFSQKYWVAVKSSPIDALIFFRGVQPKHQPAIQNGHL